MTRPKRKGRWETPPAKLSRKRVRTILVEDAVAGRETPIPWALAAYHYLGRGVPEKVDAEFASVRDEVASKGRMMPGTAA